MMPAGSPMPLRLARLLPCLLLVACGERPAPPPPPPPPPPASNWHADDSQAVAHDLVDAAVKNPWLVSFKTRTNRSPVVRVGEIDDRSDDHVDVGTLEADLAQDLAQSQQVQVTEDPDKADFTLAGQVSREPIPGGGRYAVDLHLTGRDGEVAWNGGIEREIMGSTPAPAPAPTPPPESPAGH